MVIDKDKDLKKVDMVGIWKARKRNNGIYYERDASHYKEFSYWAWTLSIPEKSDKYRIILLGDSVAMGYFYQPIFTPALYLEKVLKGTMPDREAEVIDLSCRSISYEGFFELCSSSLKLKPDAVVVFIGGDWWDNDYQLTCEEAGYIVDTNGEPQIYDRILEAAERRLRPKIDAFMGFLANMAEQHSIRVVLIIPETNLKDWTNCKNGLASYMSRSNGAVMSEFKRSADTAYANGNIDKAVEILKKILDVNPYNPVVLENIAKYRLEQGQTSEAKRYYRMACDTQIYRNGHISSSTGAMKRWILESASACKLHILDLQQVFDSHLKGGIPGKDLFMDSYHMSAEGICTAMNHVALELLSIITGKHYSQEQLKAKPMEYEEKDRNMVLGKAHLLAAVHCMQEGNQPYGLLFYHCSEALNYWPESAKAMEMYIELITAKVPWFMHKHYTTLSKMDFWPVFPDRFHLLGIKRMGNELIDAMTDALRAKNIDIKAYVDQLRMKGFGPVDRRVDLLETYYRKDSYCTDKMQLLLGVCEEYGYYTGTEPISVFFIPADGKSDITLDITLKTPLQAQANEVIFMLNGLRLCTHNAYCTWTDCKITIPKAAVSNYVINSIEIEWPVDGLAQYSNIGSSVSRGFSHNEKLYEQLMPVYGCISRFEARYS